MAVLLAAAVFVGFVGVVLAAYWLFIVVPERKVLDRLVPKTEAIKKRRGVVKPETPEETSRVQVAARPLTDRVKQMLEQAGSKQAAGPFIFLSVMLAGIGALVGGLVVGWMTAVALALLAGAMPTMAMRQVRAKRLRKFEEHFPEAIDLISRALRAGHALPTGLGMVADEMPAPVGKEFRILFDEQNFGLTLTDALRNFARRMPVIDARFFVVAVLIQRESGGNLAEVLDNLSSVIRERFKVKREVSAKSAHGRMTGWVLSALPPGLFVINGLASGGQSVRGLIDDPMGMFLIKTAICLQVLGTLAIRKLVNIQY